MLTGKQLREQREKKQYSAAKVAKGAGISLNTLYTWETAKEVKPRNRQALAKVVDILGFSMKEKLSFSLVSPAEVKKMKGFNSKKAAAAAAGSAMKSWAAPAGVTHALVVGIGGGGGGGDKHGPADVAELTTMLGFFMGDQARRTNLGRLLKAAQRVGLTIHGLERAIDGNG